MKYIKVAIDHGTSNSSVAFLENGKPVVIKPNLLDDTMPSVVYIDKYKRREAGRKARYAMLVGRPSDGDGHTRYKPDIGQDGRYEFRAARLSLTAPELGAEVISRLLKCYADVNPQDEYPKACVITMPAKFEDNAKAGTRKAACLAGLEHCHLLMEPVAAALAYGFQNTNEKARWMIFDLGGGTLDVSLVSVRTGKMIVEDTAGDTRLGGNNFDRVVMDYALRELSRNYTLKPLIANHEDFRVAWNKLLLACEDAKIKLSEEESALIVVEGTLCLDERGVEVKVKVPITREQYVRMIVGDLEKSLNCCQALLRKNKLEAKAVDRLILVGGPTKTPVLQQMLRDRLRIPFDTRIDPMTAVVQGAALFAATQEDPTEGGDDNGKTTTLRLVYSRDSKLPTCQVMGSIAGPAASAQGLSVEIKRQAHTGAGGWASERWPVDKDHTFTGEVRLIEQPGELSHFTTTLLDASGRPLCSVPEPEIFYQLGTDIDTSLPSSLMVATENNETAILLPAGKKLPAKGKGNFETTKDLRRGSGADVLKIAVLEAVTNLFFGEEDQHADCCAHIGSIVIAGDDARLTSDLPAGTEVIVRLRQDVSHLIRASAYIPVLNAEFSASLNSEAFEIDLKELAQRYANLQARLAYVEKLQQQYPLSEVADALAVVHSVEATKRIEQGLERARQGETNARFRVYKNVLELAGTLNQIQKLQLKPRLQDTIERLRPAVQNQEKAELAQLAQELQASDADLSSVDARLQRLDIMLRVRPVYQLYRDGRAFPERFNVNPEQAAAWYELKALCEELDPIPYEDISQQKVEQAKQLHKRLMQLWPELSDWLAKLPPMKEGIDLRKK